MKTGKFFIWCFLLAVTVCQPVAAGNRNCTAAFVTSGICTVATDRLLYYSISTVDPDNGGPRLALASELVEGIAIAHSYQATVICTPALVTAGTCSQVQLDAGASVPNPETKANFADRIIRRNLAGYVRLYREAREEADKRARLAADPSPDELGQ